jgi:hypothetical protein
MQHSFHTQVRDQGFRVSGGSTEVWGIRTLEVPSCEEKVSCSLLWPGLLWPCTSDFLSAIVLHFALLCS